MRCLITGAGGLLGSAFSALMDHRGVEYKALAKSDLDVTDQRATEQCISVENPDVVFHCAAFTNVDAAESERTTSFAVNADGAQNVAKACKAVGARMVYFSTDYIFDGTKRSTQPWFAPKPQRLVSNIWQRINGWFAHGWLI